MSLATVIRVHTLLLTMLAAHSSAQAADMHQRSYVAVASSLVRLGDVVTCPHNDNEQVARLLRLELFPAPAEGKSLRLSRQELRQTLHLHGVDLSGWTLAGADKTILVYKPSLVRPTSDKNEVSSEQPASAPSQTPEKSPETKQSQTTPASFQTPAPPVSAPVTPAPALPQVVTAIRPISQGEIVNASDVELIPANDQRTAERAYHDLSEVVGKEAKRLIPARWGIDSSYVQPQQLVKRNEQVTVRAKAAGVTVTVRGVAQGNGAAGDLVAVTPEGTKDTVLARVTGLRELEVFASGPKY